MKVKGFASIGDLEEDVQIEIIAEKLDEGLAVGLFLDTHTRADRYLQKLAGRAREIWRGPGPVPGTICVKLQGLKH